MQSTLHSRVCRPVCEPKTLQTVFCWPVVGDCRRHWSTLPTQTTLTARSCPQGWLLGTPPPTLPQPSPLLSVWWGSILCTNWGTGSLPWSAMSSWGRPTLCQTCRCAAGEALQWWELHIRGPVQNQETCWNHTGTAMRFVLFNAIIPAMVT